MRAGQDHEPKIKNAAPTELEKGLVCVGCYRHGAPTELFKMVHGHSAWAKQIDALQEPSVQWRKGLLSRPSSPTKLVVPMKEREKNHRCRFMDSKREFNSCSALPVTMAERDVLSRRAKDRRANRVISVPGSGIYPSVLRRSPLKEDLFFRFCTIHC
jgi:hypothetical protein